MSNGTYQCNICGAIGDDEVRSCICGSYVTPVDQMSKGESEFPENHYLHLYYEGRKELDSLRKQNEIYKTALEDIEMAPRISHKDSLIDAIQSVARLALGKCK